MLALLSLLAACRNDPPPPDADDDGYGEDVDCNDGDPDVHPDATEVCDGVDQDCDGSVDDDPSDGVDVFVDADGDGFGDDATARLACEALDGESTEGGDCDDARDDIHPYAVESDCDDPVDYNCDGATGYADGDNDGFAACKECDDTVATTFPGAPEICNEIDDDCDLEVDDNPTDAATWNLDADGDGFGRTDGKFALEECSQPDGYVADATDCDDLDASLNPATPWYADADGDGYGDPASALAQCEAPEGHVRNADDCADADASLNPDTLWYADGDGDGYGDADRGVLAACEAPSGYAPTSTDCNDGIATVNPGATEVCDLVDNDCNGTTDDDYSADALTWYADADGDGFGLASSTAVACYAPSGFGGEAGDCDDASADVNPDAEEICNDGVDQDCNASSGSCSLDLSDADAVLEGNSSHDSAGTLVKGAGDLDGDGNDDLIVTAAYDDEVAEESGALYLIYGPVTSHTLGSLGATLTGEGSRTRLGTGADVGGDFDGDGQVDLLLGALRAAGGGTLRGESYLYYGGAALSGSMDAGDAADIVFQGESNSDRLGAGVAFIGDVDGSGTDDIAMGAEYDDDGGTDAGAFYIVEGPTSSGTVNVSNATGKIVAQEASAYAGAVLSGVGDVDGDGNADFVVANPDASSSAGAVWLFHGPVSGSVKTSDADLILTGGGIDEAGHSLSALGDVDGDGSDDWAVGAPGSDAADTNAGIVYLVSGALGTDGALKTSSFASLNGNRGDRLGESVAGGVDMDGDGHDDLAASAIAYGASGEGAAWVLLLTPTTSGSLTVDFDTRARAEGAMPNDTAGGSVDLAMMDGAPTLLVSATGADLNGGGSGAAYLVATPAE